jgi:hypothetical protein
MDLVTDIALTGIVPSLLLSGGGWAAGRLHERLPERRRWRLRDPSRLSICVSKKQGKSTRTSSTPPYTGIGQTLALSLITPSLSRAYPRIGIPQVHFPDQIREATENDVVLLGGPKTNDLSADILRLVAERTGVVLGTEDLRIPGHEPLAHGLSREPLTEDYGLVARIGNPWSASPRTCVLFAGSHTYGVVAAARYFVEQVRPLRRRYSGDFVAVVRSEIRNAHVLPPREVHFAAAGTVVRAPEVVPAVQ